jgi:predicted Zn-ribbon and HTH transcriptional regulator
MLTPALDKAERCQCVLISDQCAMVVDDNGDWLDLGDVRAAYALDIEAAVAEARADERARIVALLRTKRTPEGETITGAVHAADVIERVFGERSSVDKAWDRFKVAMIPEWECGQCGKTLTESEIVGVGARCGCCGAQSVHRKRDAVQEGSKP